MCVLVLVPQVIGNRTWRPLLLGEPVTVEPAGDGELRVRRSTLTFESAFGALTGTYPAGYLAQLDADDEER